MSGEGSPTRTVSYPYLRNMLGFQVDDESMKVVPHAKAELYFHVMTKFSEAFAIIGGAVGAGLGAVRSGHTVGGGFMSGTRNGMLIGIPVGLLVTYGRMSSLQKAGNTDMDYAYFDRSYRLRHNRNQVRVDRMAYVGLGTGMIAGCVAGAGFTVLHTGAAGLVAGTFAAGAYNTVFEKKK